MNRLPNFLWVNLGIHFRFGRLWYYEGRLFYFEELSVVYLCVFEEVNCILMELFLPDFVPGLPDFCIEECLAVFSHELVKQFIGGRHELWLMVGVHEAVFSVLI